MTQPDDQPKDYESAMGGMTLDSASSTGIGEQDIKDMEENLDVETERQSQQGMKLKVNYRNEILNYEL